jgi:tRNA-Thr(GGU) m(6)t(6)A37 methyltransferase TsaA
MCSLFASFRFSISEVALQESNKTQERGNKQLTAEEVDSLNEESAGNLELRPIGVIRDSDRGPVLRLFPAYRGGLRGVREFSHIWVFYWFHENDNPDGRAVLEVHPRKDPVNPLTGVFGTRSPLRPNLLAMHLCEIREIRLEEGEIIVRSLDAREGSPLVDIKPYLPYSDRADDLRLPEWARTPPKEKEKE